MKQRLIGGVNRIPQNKLWTLSDFYTRRNHILIQRKTGGFGDILMHRMIFEDFKLLCPDIRITFACPKIYHQAVEDHPFIDELVDHIEINPNDFLVKYDTTTVCGQTEMINAPKSSPHRSDIWADACDIQLTRHNMHLTVNTEDGAYAREQIAKIKNRPGPVVGFSPLSAISSKNLDINQSNAIINGVHKLGCFIFGLHALPILNFDAPQLSGKNTRNFIALIQACDYIITVDSAAFHVAGGFSKPQVGVFSWADGKVYGKYYQNWELVQRHRDNGNWDCGPCYNWGLCTKCDYKIIRKPCITEITAKEVLEAFQRLILKFPK